MLGVNTYIKSKNNHYTLLRSCSNIPPARYGRVRVEFEYMIRRVSIKITEQRSAQECEEGYMRYIIV